MILVVGAHPDDAEIGAGGFLAREGGVILSMTDGVNGTRDPDVAAWEQGESADVLGVEWRILPNAQIAAVTRQLVTMIDEAIEEISPDTIITHSPRDSNQEHAATSQAVIAAARRHDNILFFEPVPPSGRCEFRPQFYVDISEEAEKKYQAMGCFKSQMIRRGRDPVKTRRALDSWRGAEVGVESCECYEVLRWRL